jgi:YggT family protein
MLNPFIELLGNLIHLYKICVIAWLIVSLLVSFKIVNAYQPIVQKLMYALSRLVEPALKPIRKFLPDLGGIDIAPVILWLLLDFANSALFRYFYNL